ncbi:very short patch repair endonuclease, partial [Nocardia puris]|nr:very short patch repair endonuclease [Nocardia puris]
TGRWWADTLAGHVARDRATDEALRAAGWQVVRVWEHEDPIAAADRVQAALSAEPAPGPTSAGRARPHDSTPPSPR